MMTTKPKLIVPKHVWDGAEAEKKKNELEKVPKPVGWRIVLFPLKLQGKTKGGIHLTDDTIQESQITTNICKVLKTGSLCYTDKERYPDGPWCKEGDWILVSKYSGHRFEYEGCELRLINDDSVLAVVSDPTKISRANA